MCLSNSRKYDHHHQKSRERCGRGVETDAKGNSGLFSGEVNSGIFLHMFRSSTLNTYCECFKCLLGCSFSVTRWVQIQLRIRLGLLVPFDHVHMKHRGDPTIAASACGLRPSGSLMGSQWHLPLLCRRAASLGFPEGETETGCESSNGRRALLFGQLRKGKACPWVQSSPCETSVCHIGSWVTPFHRSVTLENVTAPDLLQPCKRHLKASTHSYMLPLVRFDCPANALVERFRGDFYSRGCPLAPGCTFWRVSLYWCVVAVLYCIPLGCSASLYLPFSVFSGFFFSAYCSL